MGALAGNSKGGVDTAKTTHLHDVVRWLEGNPQRDRLEGGLQLEQRTEPAYEVGPLLSFIDDEDQVVGELFSGKGFGESHHHRQAALHVRASTTENQPAVDMSRRVRRVGRKGVQVTHQTDGGPRIGKIPQGD